MVISLYFHALFIFLRKNLLELNLFQDGVQDQVAIRNQRRSSRLYLILLFFPLFIIGLYNIVTIHLEVVVINSPSFNQYSTHFKEPTLQCFCTKIAVKYEEFIEVEPFFHELCQSDLISDDYINQLYTLYQKTWNNSIVTDFHRIAIYQFRTLRTFCQLTQETIQNHLQTFLQTDFIQPQLVSDQSMQIQTAALLVDFVDSTPRLFLRMLEFIQNTTAQSLFMTGASITSVFFRFPQNIQSNDRPSFDGITYTFTDGSSCTCSSSTSTTCMGLATLENSTIVGFQTGCYMLSALLKSTLEAFYNQTYVNLLTESSSRFQKLDSSVSTNKTIEELLPHMFVIEWRNQTFFQRYFDACAPDSCQYTIISRPDFSYIVTSLIGLFGGLSSILRIIAPNLVNRVWPLILKLKRRREIFSIPTVDISVNRGQFYFSFHCTYFFVV
jgi:hypothetical protein